MKRPIKFRGRGLDGKIYFGDVYHAGKSVGIHVIGKGNFEVEPDSIAQLVGYDFYGKEIYEGDPVIDRFHFEHTAGLYTSLHGDEILKEAES